MNGRSVTNPPGAPERDLYREIAALRLAPLWHYARELLPAEPSPAAAPYRWAYDDVHRALRRAADVVDPREADRRVLLLANPGVATLATAPTLLAGVQMLLPGELAPAHRHTAAAVRLIVEGDGAYTVTDGRKVAMAPGDLVITPSWAWHEHDSEGHGPVVWLDVLDVPLVRMLECGFFQLHPDVRQARGAGLDDSPSTAPDRGTRLRYPWDAVAAALAARAGAGDMATFDYLDPVTGGAVTATVGCHAHMLTPGGSSRLRQETASSILHVVSGKGMSVIGGEEVRWTARDTFVVPGWAPVTHRNLDPREPAFLFSVDDGPALKALGFYRSA